MPVDGCRIDPQYAETKCENQKNKDVDFVPQEQIAREEITPQNVKAQPKPVVKDKVILQTRSDQSLALIQGGRGGPGRSNCEK